MLWEKSFPTYPTLSSKQKRLMVQQVPHFSIPPTQPSKPLSE